MWGSGHRPAPPPRPAIRTQKTRYVSTFILKHAASTPTSLQGTSGVWERTTSLQSDAPHPEPGPQAGWACILHPAGGPQSPSCCRGHRRLALRGLPRRLGAPRGPRRAPAAPHVLCHLLAGRPLGSLLPPQRPAPQSAVSPPLRWSRVAARGHAGILYQSPRWPSGLPRAAPGGLLD